jgi:sarcosine oxidase
VEAQIDVAVVGAGIMGLAATRALAQAGRRVTCFEQFQVGHSRGSSHGTSRIFRLAYEDPAYAQSAHEALPLWRDLERELDERILHTTGSLDVGGDLRGFRSALAGAGVEAEMLQAEDIRSRFPTLRLPDAAALFHAEGGVLHADRATAALARSALASGAVIAEGMRIGRLDQDDGGVLLDTSEGTVGARAVVVAAGAWVRDLIGELPVSVTRETVAHFRLAQDGLPTVIDHEQPDVPTLLSHQATYALASPGIGLKVGVHRSGAPADPGKEGAPDRAVLDTLVRWARERYELLEPDPAFVETCLYTSTEDERFLVERRGRIVVCSACSGHGFKFAPVLGKQLQALAEEALAN